MAYYRFEGLEQIVASPALSTGKGAVIEGRYLTLRNNNKEPGTGSELHYHPNELIVFSLVGKLNCIVGKDRRIVPPGVMVHMPSKVRHAIRATEDGPVSYLYVKDRTWGLTGFAADEALSEEAGRDSDGASDGAAPGAIIEGLATCYYPIIEDFHAPPISAERRVRIAGERVVFNFVDAPAGRREPELSSASERFIYILAGSLEAAIGGERRQVANGDILHIARGESFGYETGTAGARWVAFEPSAYLEARIDRDMPSA